MDRNVALYQIICKADSITSDKGWVYLLYYPVLKEIDSMQRHILTGQGISSFDMTLEDGFYYDFRLYDEGLPTVSLKEFISILNESELFVPSPLKEYACGVNEYKNKRLLVNYHDASPCFSYCGDHFRLAPSNESLVITDKERNSVLLFIMDQFEAKKLVSHDIFISLREILYQYITRASQMFPTIAQWLYPLMRHYDGDVITDQTLAPGQCCVNHLLKSSGHLITVLQHQKNLILTDIFPILYLDFLLADRYISWFSREMLLHNYYPFRHSFPGDIVQQGTIGFKLQTSSFVANKIGFGRRCLYILTYRAKKFISGTMLGKEGSIRDEIALLKGMNFDVYIRKDPRDIVDLCRDSVKTDESPSLSNAIEQYDLCICDRPGGATIEVLVKKGFVLVRSGLYEFRKTQTYKDLNAKQQFIRDCLPLERRKLLDMYDLLCA